MHDEAFLAKQANQIRQHIIRMLVQAGSGHAAGPLGMADIFSALYFQVLKHKPKQPDWEERDRLILSCGHICPVLYASLAMAGYFSIEELTTLRQLDSRLQGHTHKDIEDSLKNLPGIENTSGPLGQGVSQAVGLAVAARCDQKAWRVVCVTSDGEQQEGQVWEAYLAAVKYKLGNLTFILDLNQIQIDGYTHQVMPLEPLAAKYRAFGLEVLDIDGHNFEAIIDAYQKSLTIHDRPTMIMAHTIPGKDVEFMENLPEWHGKPPTIGETIEALQELRTLYGQIQWE